MLPVPDALADFNQTWPEEPLTHALYKL